MRNFNFVYTLAAPVDKSGGVGLLISPLQAFVLKVHEGKMQTILILFMAVGRMHSDEVKYLFRAA